MSGPAPHPRILIRADARPDLGGGHIMRCLSLANALVAKGARIAFASAPGSADLVPALQRSGFPVLDASAPADTPMPPDWRQRADAVIIDMYESSAEDERALRDRSGVVAAFEDLPDRLHDCDLLVDQGVGRQDTDYAHRVPAGTQLLLGAHMVPLRSEFATLRAASLQRRATATTINRLIIAMGLTDLNGISAKIYRLARDAFPKTEIEVILGPTAPSLAALADCERTDPLLSVRVDVDDMAQRMADADLAIGAGGGTALERCVLGLPSIVVVLADNQKSAAAALEERGAAVTIDASDRIEQALPKILESMTPDRLRSISRAAAEICDGQGADRIADSLLQLIANPA